MQLNEVLNDKKLLYILSDYQYDKKDGVSNQQNSLDERFSSWLKALSSNQFIIPILGVQGAGKSSLLNALLMDGTVLPVDADETTCIPTEIIYSDKESDYAEIIFKNGKTEKAVLSEDGLNPYVNNEKNPRNEKEISHIRIKKNNDLLRNGIMLVDLPGMGSLTKENIETTSNYIKKSNGAIFLITTVPPITQSEAIFIQGVWPLLAKVFFIQNQWNDETNKEVEDGKEENIKILKKIAKESKLINSDINIDIINIKKALTSKNTNNVEAFNKSGIISLQNKIQRFVKEWKIEIVDNIKNSLILIIDNSLYYIKKEINATEISKEELKKNIQSDRNIFTLKYIEEKKKVKECFDILRNERAIINKKTIETVKKAKENFRNNMREIINEGITDGDDLQSAFNDINEEQINIIFGEIQPLYHDFIGKIQEKVSNIFKNDLNSINNKQNVGIGSKIKWDKPIEMSGSLAGAIGGFLIGGPIGSLIGGLFGMFLGKKTSSLVIKKRAESAKRTVFHLIENWSEEIESDFLKQLETGLENVKINVENEMKKTKDIFDDNEQKLQKTLSSSVNENENNKKELQSKLNVLGDYHSMLKEIK